MTSLTPAARASSLWRLKWRENKGKSQIPVFFFFSFMKLWIPTLRQTVQNYIGKNLSPNLVANPITNTKTFCLLQTQLYYYCSFLF